MRELVLNLTVGEAKTSHESVWHVDECSYLNLDLFTLLMELHLSALQFVAIATNE